MVDGCPRPLSTMEWSKRAGAFDMSKFLIKFKDRHMVFEGTMRNHTFCCLIRRLPNRILTTHFH